MNGETLFSFVNRLRKKLTTVLNEQVSSSAGLDALTRGNSGALEEVQLTITAAANARLSPDADGGGTENRWELDRLVSMAADLGDIVVGSRLIYVVDVWTHYNKGDGAERMRVMRNRLVRCVLWEALVVVHGPRAK